MRVNSLRNVLACVGIVTLAIACGVSEYRAKSAPPAVRGVAMDTSRHMGELAAAPAAQVAGKAMTAAATEPSSLQAAEGAGQPAIGIGAMAASQPDRYLIKNATILIETDDARAATDQLTASLQTLGGYVGDLHESTDGLGRRSVTMQIRVPADKFDTSMQSLESIGKVLNKQVTTQDVTEEFVDTDARTRNLKKMEERLLDHLNRFGELKDILGVEKELTRVR
ncbi:MAG: DUF4349 domain-containing protein, partial [Candidatus Hydrogenedentes bacterium]|nr:DUF4349 domain-containing protein [Candidatus Hydrogenedentota bacterium]